MPLDAIDFNPNAFQNNSPIMWDDVINFTSEQPSTFGLQGSTTMSPDVCQPNLQASFEIWPVASRRQTSAGLGVAGLADRGPAAPAFSSEHMATHDRAQPSVPLSPQNFRTSPTPATVSSGHGNPTSGKEPGGLTCDKSSCKGRSFESANELM